METLAQVLPIIIYILLIVFLIVGIILGIKLIITVDTINEVIDDVRSKVKSLDGVFKVIDMASNKFGMVTTAVSEWVTSLISKVVSLKHRKDEEEDYE